MADTKPPRITAEINPTLDPIHMPRSWFAWMMVGPALTVIAVFFFLPVIAALLLSFTDFDLYALSDISNLRFVYLKNYVQLLDKPEFWQALKNTLYFVVVGVPFSFCLALFTALMLNSVALKATAFFRTSIYLPVVATMVAVAIIWKYVLHVRFGWFNYALTSMGFEPVNWLGDPKWSMPAIILFAAWKNFGANAIILLAGLQTISGDLYEAATIDGVSRWKQFTRITLPLLRPSVFFVGISTVSGYFQLFGEPYVMTQGGPMGSTMSVLYLMFNEGFKYWNMGTASATAFLLFILIAAVTAFLMRFDSKGAD